MHTIFWLEKLNGRELGRAKRRWEYNIKMGLMEMRWKAVDWMYLARDLDQWRAAVNTVMKCRVP
jgi:hypothetical protein